jgi:hypothetical protein
MELAGLEPAIPGCAPGGNFFTPSASKWAAQAATFCFRWRLPNRVRKFDSCQGTSDATVCIFLYTETHG